MHDKADIYDAAVSKFGIESRLALMQEEAAELIAAINRHLRGRHGAEQVLEEMGDTYVMLMQMAVIFGHTAFDEACKESMEKLRRHYDGDLKERENEHRKLNLLELEYVMKKARKLDHEHD